MSMSVPDRVRKAHLSIMRHPKFCVYSGVLSCGSVKYTDAIPTACTDGWDVLYNPKFITEYAATDPELRFLVLHEATHKAYRHMATWRGLHEEDSRLANLAADHFVNLSLQDTDSGAEFVKMLRVGVKPDPKYRGWSVKQIFDDLKQNPPDEDGQGDGEGDGMDSHDWEQGAGKDPTEAQAQAEEIQRAIRQGEIIRKKIGKGSGDSAGAFDDLLQPKVDWRKVLREFVTETCAGRDESTWRKLNRRFMDEGICMPSMIGTTITELVVGFDTSGSCFNSADMARFVAEITRIIEDIKPNKCRVVYWDTKVVGEQVFEDGQFAVQNLKPKGGGGTDGSVLFDYLRENRINPNAIVQFTDGEIGDWGRSDWPTLWAITSNIRSPYGVTINIKE